jgi:hypothetical protein
MHEALTNQQAEEEGFVRQGYPWNY